MRVYATRVYAPIQIRPRLRGVLGRTSDRWEPVTGGGAPGVNQNECCASGNRRHE